MATLVGSPPILEAVWTSGGGGTPGGTSTNIQFRQSASVFGGIPGSTADGTNGLMALAPTGTGVALSVTGDAHANDIALFYGGAYNVVQIAQPGSSLPSMTVLGDTAGAMSIDNSSTADPDHNSTIVVIGNGTPSNASGLLITTVPSADPSASGWAGLTSQVNVRPPGGYLSNQAWNAAVLEITSQPNGGIGGITFNLPLSALQANATLGSGAADTAPAIYGISSSVSAAVTAVATNGYALFVPSSANLQGTISHLYGLYIDDQTLVGVSGSNPDPWAIYAAGGKSYHAGNFSFGAHLNADDTSGSPPYANTDLASTVTVSGSTSASVNFTTNFTSAPIVVLTPQSDPTATGGWWVTTTNSGFTVHVTLSGTITFNYVVIGNPN